MADSIFIGRSDDGADQALVLRRATGTG